MRQSLISTSQNTNCSRILNISNMFRGPLAQRAFQHLGLHLFKGLLMAWTANRKRQTHKYGNSAGAVPGHEKDRMAIICDPRNGPGARHDADWTACIAETRRRQVAAVPAASACGVQLDQFLREMGVETSLQVWTDSTAVVGSACQKHRRMPFCHSLCQISIKSSTNV